MSITLNDLSLRGIIDKVIEVSQQHPILTFSTAIGIAIFLIATLSPKPMAKTPTRTTGPPLSWETGNKNSVGHILPSVAVARISLIALPFSGDVFYLNAAGQPIVVLNSQKVAADLLDRRAGIYSDRPRNIVAAQILCGGLALTFQNYGPLWRRMRKAVHEGLSIESLKVPQLNEALLLTSGLIAQPATMDNHLRRATASMIMSVTYGTPPIVSELDPGIKAINDFVARLTRAILPGTALGGILSVDEAYSEQFPRILDSPNGSAMLSIGTRKIRSCSRAYSIAVREKMKSTGYLIGKNLGLPQSCTSISAAGAETTSGVLAWWMLAMITFPEIQKRAQTELDAVVGRSRTPTFADFQHLPYIRAMVKETLRWCPVGPVGIPHLSSEDDWYNGMFIPKGTIMITLWTSIQRGFWMPMETSLRARPETKEEGHVTYGFGRRICVGKHVANNSLFIDMAMTLWACNIEAWKDEHGNVIPIDVGWIGGERNCRCVVLAGSRPVPFKADITPRFPEVVGLLASEREFREP
ncbi:cytochrome P450 [Lactarius indigo]|nr:cytochrome P450 [Lactarius indigo]